jgi:sortase A
VSEAPGNHHLTPMAGMRWAYSMQNVSGRIRLAIGPALLATGAALVLYVASAWYEGQRLEREARREAARRSNATRFAERDEVRRQAETTGRIGHLEIRRVRLRAPVLEGIDSKALRLGVGHVPQTALPGEPDNATLAAHRDTHFAKLRRVEKGDSIRIATAEGIFSYVVDSTFVVLPDRVDLLRPTGRPMLTLVTCYPFGWIGSAPKRFIVRARGVVEEARPGPLAIAG